MSQATQHRLHLWGWILFILSAIFFMASSIRAGDPLSLAGGALFLVACFVFLAPLLAGLWSWKCRFILQWMLNQNGRKVR